MSQQSKRCGDCEEDDDEEAAHENSKPHEEQDLGFWGTASREHASTARGRYSLMLEAASNATSIPMAAIAIPCLCPNIADTIIGADDKVYHGKSATPDRVPFVREHGSPPLPRGEGRGDDSGLL